MSLRRSTPSNIEHKGTWQEGAKGIQEVHYGLQGGFGVGYAILALAVLLIGSNALALPAFQEVKSSHKKSDALLLDRHGKVIHELRVDSMGRRLEWVGLGEISPALIKSVIHSEDRRFYEHRGVDWTAAGSAALGYLFGKTQRGASTLTMQLASMLDKSLTPRGSKKTIPQKWAQMKAATDIESTWTKKEIIEAYLNLVTFRGELQGIAAAARGLFGKEPHGLAENEALLLAVLIRSPNASGADVSHRVCRLRESMKSSTRCEDLESLVDRTLTVPYLLRQRVALAPHVAHALLNGTTSSVLSTLDGDLQRFAAAALGHHIGAVRSQNVMDGAVLVVENRTGEILAYVGNIGKESSAWHVDGVRGKRQAGSTLKPFLYALALERRLLTPASLLDDSPLDVSTSTGIYKPENYESDYKGMVSVRTALASSLNVPAVRVINVTGVGPFVQKLRDMRFSHLESDDYYGPSVALGSADVSLYELVNAYRTLANRGVWSKVKLTPEKTKGKGTRVFTEETAFVVTDILSDREARSATFGLENPLVTRFWTAAKTGTSKDMRDNWCIGYSSRYTVGVWVGNFSGHSMWNVSGVAGAAPVWLEIMNWLHKDSKSRPPQRPAGVIASQVQFKDGVEPERAEIFKGGTERTSIAIARGHEEPRIAYPADGTIIALDPDIPEENQVIVFEAEAPDKLSRWVLNNEDIGPANDIVLWKPRNGKYVLSILNSEDKIVDSIEFKVRGTKAAD